MAALCGLLPALIETFPWANTSWGFLFLLILFRTQRCSIRGKFGLSCRKGTPRGCFLDVSFLPNSLFFFLRFYFFGYCCCGTWSKSASWFKWCSRRGGVQICSLANSQDSLQKPCFGNQSMVDLTKCPEVMEELRPYQKVLWCEYLVTVKKRCWGQGS